ncbi:hypothetical protein [Streptomyces sp. ALI-76-A]|uniref:hypothetical protein n=1 Tax=Streptomyces sp. ALI-76-A TaxID=3025736 RepID=UPI00256EBF00|nr:hypothetical protein [Streptomyces sp. ALI-76-A]MDL5205764.1 hypothetical protein [Streptomyces sp. ALI-76-A]
MSENALSNELTSQYTAQVTADLERNTKEQERIGGEIAALQEQLAVLQRDHTVLVSIQRAIEASPVRAEPTAPSDTVAVPAPRKKTATKTGAAAQERPAKKTAKTAKATKTAKPAAKSRRSTAAKTAAEQPAAKAEPEKTAQPTLVDLVRNHLGEQSEPRSAAEIATALGEAHPERGVKTTVVRTTLEGLVARNQAQRTKQGSSVFYTTPGAAKETTPSSADKQSAPADA